MPAPSYIPLATTTLAANATSVTFGSIPTNANGVTFRDLIVVVNGTTTATPGYFYLYFNGDTNSYTRSEMSGNGSGTSPFSTSNSIIVTFLQGTNSTHITQIMDYTATNKHKTWIYRNSITGNSGALAGVGRWASTAAVTSLSLSSFSGGTFVTGTTVSLFGIAG